MASVMAREIFILVEVILGMDTINYGNITASGRVAVYSELI